jgi:hypothetical protein
LGSISQDEEAQLVKLLGKLPVGFLPLKIFIEIARLTTLSIIEFVPFRKNNGHTEVLLLKRDQDDALWPDELHTPGTVIRPSDLDSDDHLAFKRILDEELAGTKVSEPFYVGSNLHKSRRGAEQAQIFWVEVLEEPRSGRFYRIDALPPNMMGSQVGFVRLAADSFRRVKRHKE